MAGQIMTRRGQQMMVREGPKAKGAESKHHHSSPVIKVSGTGNFIKILHTTRVLGFRKRTLKNISILLKRSKKYFPNLNDKINKGSMFR
jgi:hypothetical protein